MEWYGVFNQITRKIDYIVRIGDCFDGWDNWPNVLDSCKYARKITLEEYKEHLKNILEEELKKKIKSGFTYTLEGITYKFEWSESDRLIYAELANLCVMEKIKGEKIPFRIEIPVYYIDAGSHISLHVLPDEFLKIYTKSVEHVGTCRNNMLYKLKYILNAKNMSELDTLVEELGIYNNNQTKE